MHTIDVYKDKKRHKVDTTDSTTHDESSEAIKSIPRPKTAKLSTRMQIRKRLNEICLEQNLEKQLASLERARKDLSNDIKNSQIGDQMLKICLQE